MEVLCTILCCGETDSYRLLDEAKAGDVDAVRGTLEKKPRLAWKAQQWGGQTAWHVAAREGHADVLQAMANVLQADPASLTPPEELCRSPHDLTEALVQAPDSKGLTALHLACIKGHTETVEVLMQLGANPFAMDSVGRTPLHYAASWGFADCINAVLGQHSGPAKESWDYAWPNTGDTRLVDVQNAAGFTPLHYAVWVGRKEAIQALASYDASLKVVNNGNDFDWIKVGSGNTPLHLAAFGGDLQVVKLLLAAYVQSLAAGAEVMTAGRNQWGNRYTDDVRHMRNRRGWMPYHIAIHKGFDYLAELLHPDIPYTFIFSNDDMAPGSVRMFGPARLMVIAAKALQQKLVDELTAVEAATATLSDKDAPAAGATNTTTVVLVAAPKGDSTAEGAAAAAAAAAADGQAGLGGTISAPAVIGAPIGSTPAAAAGGLSATSASHPGPPIVSPFVAYTGRGWTQSSFSAGASEPASAANSATAVPTPPAADSLSASPAGTAAAAAAAVPAAVAATAAAAAVRVSTGTDRTEHSFTLAEAQAARAGAAADPAAAAVPEGQAVKHSTSHSSFSGFAPTQQPAGAAAAAAAAAAGASSDAGSTVATSNAAVAGSAPGSISLGPISRNSSSSRLPQSTLLSPTGQPVTAIPASSGTRSVQWGPADGSSTASSHHHHHQQQQQQGVSLQQAPRPPTRHRRVQSAAHVGVYSRQGSRGLSDTAVGARGDDQQQAKFGWPRMDSTKRRSSRKDFLEMLPPSAVQTCAEDDTDAGSSSRTQQQPGTSAAANSTGPQDAAAAGSAIRGPLRRISSLPSRVGSRTQSAAQAAAEQQQQQQQQQQVAADAFVEHPVHENPLNVVLAARAEQIGDDPEAIRRQLLTMKLASGALQFDNAVSTFTTSLGASAGADRAVGRFASFSAGLPPSSRNSISSRTGAPGNGAVSPAGLPFSASEPSTTAVVTAAAAAAAAPPRNATMEKEAGSSPFAAAKEQQLDDTPMQHDAQQQQQQQRQQLSSLSPSPSLFNLTAANVIAQQPSQSLQRLLSGNMRGRRAGSVAAQLRQSGSQTPSVSVSPAPLTAAASAEAAVGNGCSPMGGAATAAASPAAAAAAAGNGELPIVQLQPAGPIAAAMISEGDDGDRDEEGLCEICFDATAVVALQQCQHTLCVSCCKELCKLHHFKPGLCPYCRQIISGFSRATHVFIP